MHLPSTSEHKLRSAKSPLKELQPVGLRRVTRPTLGVISEVASLWISRSCHHHAYAQLDASRLALLVCCSPA